VGKTSAGTEREIESVRDDITAALGELERRTRRVIDLSAQARRHPVVLGVVAAGVVAGSSWAGYRTFDHFRERRKPVNRLRRRAGRLVDDVDDRLARGRQSLRRYMREDEELDTRRQEPGLVKNLIWMGLTTGAVALFGLLARRVSAGLWKAFMHEPPPTSKV
jgi:hypothetical protein